MKTNYKDDLVQYQRYLKEEVRFRTELRRTVLPAKRGLLKNRLITREWLEAFRTTTKPDDVYMIGVVKAKHRALIGSKYQEWPIGGPRKWLQEWQALLCLYETWSKAQHDEWAINFILV